MKNQPLFLSYLKQRFSLVLIMLFVSVSLFAQNRPSVPVNPVSFTPSPEFSVKIDGKSMLVYSSPIPAAFCNFIMKKPVDVTIKSLTRDIKWVDIRPLSAGIKPEFKNSDSCITFRINKPGQYSIELNGSIKIPLLLFANNPETDKPDRTNKNVLFFETGKIHYPGTINLKDNQQIYIEGGAIVVGNIKGRNVNNIKISGLGILDGSYSRQFMDSCAIANKTNDTSGEPARRGGGNGLILLNECKNITIEGITVYNSKTWDVVPTLCDKVFINNIKLISDNGGDDGIDVVSTKNVFISNCFIHTKDDCIAIKSHARPPQPYGQPGSQGSPGQARQSDQSFPPLPSGPAFDVDSVHVKNCVFWNALWGNSIEIGFELSGNVSNVTFRDNDVIHTEGGAAFSIHNARRGVVSKILVDNLRVEGTDQKLFDLAIFRSIYSEDGMRDQATVNKLYLHGIWDNVLAVPEQDKESRMKYRGCIKDITLKNVSVVDGIFPFSVFYGSDKEHPVENILIENLTVHGKKITNLSDAKFYLENAKNIIIK
jgi:hypothetical protein